MTTPDTLQPDPPGATFNVYVCGSGHFAGQALVIREPLAESHFPVDDTMKLIAGFIPAASNSVLVAHERRVRWFTIDCSVLPGSKCGGCRFDLVVSQGAKNDPFEAEPRCFWRSADAYRWIAENWLRHVERPVAATADDGSIAIARANAAMHRAWDTLARGLREDSDCVRLEREEAGAIVAMLYRALVGMGVDPAHMVIAPPPSGGG